MEFFSPLWTIWGPLVLGSNNKYSNKIVAKIQHLSTETYIDPGSYNIDPGSTLVDQIQLNIIIE